MAIAFDGAHIWVANYWDGTVTELNASDGSLVRAIPGSSWCPLADSEYCDNTNPTALAFDGAHIWVANASLEVSELNASDGSLVRTISPTNCPSCGITYPAGIAFDGAHIWVANWGEGLYGDSVIELNASDGSLVRTLSGSSYGFSFAYPPVGMAFDGAHIWVANNNDNSVTEVPVG
jgi:DNA-binding beta-propeller fold protein YncE